MLDSVQPLQITGHSETIAASSSSDDADNSPQPGASPRPATLHQPPQSPQARMPPVKAPAMSPSSAVQPHKPKSSGNASEKPSTGVSSNATPSGWVQGIASGVYNVGAGGAKWVVSTTYNVGATVLGTGATVLGTGTQLARKVVARKDKSKDE
ncbi:hypothetical protein HPB52_024155 [Rhipicephalus sanguineus]|uniref:Uncharacterized protein n=1 Tax=Rhipicephalus sanguineus TaxID=34632 RepID=A0A9D4T521_RHISA|nr:hypothetical protein HPB52_024155 [Rhipicephalus sanguineus]